MMHHLWMKSSLVTSWTLILCRLSGTWTNSFHSQPTWISRGNSGCHLFPRVVKLVSIIILLPHCPASNVLINTSPYMCSPSSHVCHFHIYEHLPLQDNLLVSSGLTLLLALLIFFRALKNILAHPTKTSQKSDFHKFNQWWISTCEAVTDTSSLTTYYPCCLKYFQCWGHDRLLWTNKILQLVTLLS